MRARIQIGDIVEERGAQDTRWRVIDYWRDVVELESLDGMRRRKVVYQDVFLSEALFRISTGGKKPA